MRDAIRRLAQAWLPFMLNTIPVDSQVGRPIRIARADALPLWRRRPGCGRACVAAQPGSARPAAGTARGAGARHRPRPAIGRGPIPSARHFCQSHSVSSWMGRLMTAPVFSSAPDTPMQHTAIQRRIGIAGETRPRLHEPRGFRQLRERHVATHLPLDRKQGFAGQLAELSSRSRGVPGFALGAGVTPGDTAHAFGRDLARDQGVHFDSDETVVAAASGVLFRYRMASGAGASERVEHQRTLPGGDLKDSLHQSGRLRCVERRLRAEQRLNLFARTTCMACLVMPPPRPGNEALDFEQIADEVTLRCAVFVKVDWPGNLEFEELALDGGPETPPRAALRRSRLAS